MFVQFSDGTQSKIIATFSGPQDSEEYPNQGEVDEGDARLTDFSLSCSRLSVTPYQFKSALAQQGLYEKVLDSINTSGDLMMQLAWNEAKSFGESDPIILKIASYISKSPEQIRSFFELALTQSP
jgi:hypothetical protein